VTRSILIPGILALIGSIIQVLLGFLVAAGVTGWRIVHVGMGVLGPFSVLVLTGFALKAKSSSVPSRLLVIALMVIVMTQVYIGLQILAGADALAMLHEVTGLLIVLLLTITVLMHS
jgi:hypothetical protein